MRVFRRKPVLVKAEEWYPHKHIPGTFRLGVEEGDCDPNPPWFIQTSKGLVCLFPGVWVVIEESGRALVMNRDQFMREYEPLEEECSIKR